MIESSVLCSSTWDSDLFQDFSEVPQMSEIEDCINNFEHDSILSSCCTSPNDLSCSSSDYECLTFNEMNNILPVADSFISQILEESNTIGFGESDWSSLFDVSENCNLAVDNSTSVNKTSTKKTKKCQGYQSSKSWSKMSPEEQLTTLHALSEIVTCHMGIGEQIEIIKIIDPSVTISPDDTEFALDSSSLNDAKMKRIRDFVRKHGFSLKTNSKKMNSSSKNSFSSEKSSRSSKILSTKASSRTKRRQKKQKIVTNENVRQKRKLELHGQKEAQSGLFVYEKVIKLSNPLEEDEDVNILE